MSWNIRIIVAFVLFVAGVFTMVSIAVNQDISLESDNYYEQELAYNDQMERIRNTQLLEEKPELTVDKAQQKATLAFPEDLRSVLSEGKVQFFRPSAAHLDKSFPIRLDEKGKSTFDLAALRKGRWKVRIHWQGADKEYYEELNVNL